ncbi:hypothetical protein TWF506_008704 [Arthrobotrys conoides]|uniref:Uncharacterized protein n=1 Tax=Arthrobotrys conoides TaxID=74498 RepID=A0AAN8RYX9_9PEZI
MSRTIFYSISFAVFAASSLLTLTSTTLPRWITYTQETSSGLLTKTYGLHYSCLTTTSPPTTTCHPFPTIQDCTETPHFCTLWHSTKYLLNISLSLSLLTCLLFIFLIANKEYRRTGWKYLVLLLTTGVACQLLAMSIVSYVYENDERFFVGWRLDVCWVLCVVSWGVGGVVTGIVGLVGWVLPEEGREGGYERLQ